MDPPSATASSSPSEGRRPTLRVRWAGLADLGTIARFYRGQSAESRRNYHPYPFDRARLVPILFAMLLSSRWVRTMQRVAPNLTFVVLLAEATPGGPLVGIATIRLVHHGGAPVWARLGYLVQEGRRGEGIGSCLAVALWRTAVELGVHRGGGTVLAGNVASSRVVEPFGFRLEPTTESDSRSGARQNLMSVQDLDAVLAQVRREGGWRAAMLDADIPR